MLYFQDFGCTIRLSVDFEHCQSFRLLVLVLGVKYETLSINRFCWLGQVSSRNQGERAFEDFYPRERGMQ